MRTPYPNPSTPNQQQEHGGQVGTTTQQGYTPRGGNPKRHTPRVTTQTLSLQPSSRSSNMVAMFVQTDTETGGAVIGLATSFRVPRLQSWTAALECTESNSWHPGCSQQIQRGIKRAYCRVERWRHRPCHARVLEGGNSFKSVFKGDFRL